MLLTTLNSYFLIKIIIYFCVWQTSNCFLLLLIKRQFFLSTQRVSSLVHIENLLFLNFHNKLVLFFNLKLGVRETVLLIIRHFANRLHASSLRAALQASKTHKKKIHTYKPKKLLTAKNLAPNFITNWNNFHVHQSNRITVKVF